MSKEEDKIIGVRVTKPFMKTIERYLKVDTHQNISELVREVLRERIREDAPEIYKELFKEVER